jgi:hypothetical protein
MAGNFLGVGQTFIFSRTTQLHATWLCNGEASSSKLRRTLALLTEVSVSCVASLQVNARKVLQFTPRPLPSQSFPLHYSLSSNHPTLYTNVLTKLSPPCASLVELPLWFGNFSDTPDGRVCISVTNRYKRDACRYSEHSLIQINWKAGRSSGLMKQKVPLKDKKKLRTQINLTM